MTKSILILAASAFITSAVLTSCNTSAEKVEDAKDNVVEANEDLTKANEEYLADVERYKQETADKIAANDKYITEFKTKIEHEKKEAQADYRKKIAELEQRNADMKNKMNDYKTDGKEKWEAFKVEFGHDMDELGQAFKDLTVKNVK